MKQPTHTPSSSSPSPSVAERPSASPDLPWGAARLPSWVPDRIRSRATIRNMILAVFLAGLAVASVFGEASRYIEATVMLGLPVYVMVRLAQRRMKASGLDTVSPSSLRSASRTDALLWAGTAAARSLPRFGGGFYGLVATLTFLAYQIRELGSTEWLDLGALGELYSQASMDPFGFLTGTVAMMLWDIALPISETWLTGAIYAVVWPLLILQWGGFWALGVAIAVGMIYARVMPRLWPVVLARAATKTARLQPVSPNSSSAAASADTASDDSKH